MTSQNPVIRDELDHRSSGLSRTAEEDNIGNAWKSNSKPILTDSSKRNYFRENSDVSQSSDEGHDRITFSHDKSKHQTSSKQYKRSKHHVGNYVCHVFQFL